MTHQYPPLHRSQVYDEASIKRAAMARAISILSSGGGSGVRVVAATAAARAAPRADQRPDASRLPPARRRPARPQADPTAAPDQRFLEYVASRQEAFLTREAAAARWGELLLPAPKPARAGRALLAAGGCSLQKGVSYSGEPLIDGYLPDVPSPEACCKRCAARSECFHFTFRPSGAKAGCSLQGYGGPLVTSREYPGQTSGSKGAAPTPTPEPTPVPRPTPVPAPSPTPVPVPGAPPIFDPWAPSYPAYPNVPTGPLVPPRPVDSALPPGNAKYGEALSMAWKYYEAQRSGPRNPRERVPWRWDSHLSDRVVGGWYDAGDYLKLSYPLSASVSFLAWGLLEFRGAYIKSGQYDAARRDLKVAADYLLACYDPAAKTFIGQIGDPSVDHNYWGRPEQQGGARPIYLYKLGSMPATDLYASAAAALASSAVLFRDLNGKNKTYSNALTGAARALFAAATAREGRYSDFFVKQTRSIYPGGNMHDNVAFAAGWLFRATGEAAFLDAAAAAFARGTALERKVEVVANWDSFFAPAAALMINLAHRGQAAVPGLAAYEDFFQAKFMRAWVQADGFLDVVSTPKGMHYPKSNQWGNLQLSTTASMLALMHAKWDPQRDRKAAYVQFARGQVDYCLGSSGRSFLIGFGANWPQRAHHASSSCPDMPKACSWPQFDTKAPNPQILYGGLVAGPAGQRKNAADPDASYYDKRDDYVTNEVANDYNAGFTSALAGLLSVTV